MSVFIGNKEFLDCTECPRCKPQDGLKHGVRYGICGMGGNLVYLEPWKGGHADQAGSITMCLAVLCMRRREHNCQMM